MTWQAKIVVESPRLHRFQILDGAKPLPIAAALRLLKDDALFRSFFCGTLVASPFSGFRWEMPAMTARSAQNPCEFVLHDAPGLPKHADPVAFARHFQAATTGQLALAFPNLGRDATLIVPTPRASHDAYSHLAVFLRQRRLRKRTHFCFAAETALATFSPTTPFWLSTAGMGVAWLHVRVDSSPKYFGYGPYTRL